MIIVITTNMNEWKLYVNNVEDEEDKEAVDGISINFRNIFRNFLQKYI